MQLTVFTHDERVVNVDVGADDPVSTLQAVVETETGIPSAQQRLIFNGRPLAPQQSLRQAGLNEGDVVQMLPAPPGGQAPQGRAQQGALK